MEVAYFSTILRSWNINTRYIFKWTTDFIFYQIHQFMLFQIIFPLPMQGKWSVTAPQVNRECDRQLRQRWGCCERQIHQGYHRLWSIIFQLIMTHRSRGRRQRQQVCNSPATEGGSRLGILAWRSQKNADSVFFWLLQARMPRCESTLAAGLTFYLIICQTNEFW